MQGGSCEGGSLALVWGSLFLFFRRLFVSLTNVFPPGQETRLTPLFRVVYKWALCTLVMVSKRFRMIQEKGRRAHLYKLRLCAKTPGVFVKRFKNIKGKYKVVTEWLPP